MISKTIRFRGAQHFQTNPYVQSNPIGRAFPKQNGRIWILESIPQYTPYGKLEKCQTYELMTCRKSCPHLQWFQLIWWLKLVSGTQVFIPIHQLFFSSFRYYMVLLSECQDGRDSPYVGHPKMGCNRYFLCSEPRSSAQRETRSLDCKWIING